VRDHSVNPHGAGVVAPAPLEGLGGDFAFDVG
jgi:hypothetical protein